MTRRSLSTFYRAEVRRNDAGVDADQMLALATDAHVGSTLLERLARTPEAPALLGIARSVPAWATALAADLRRDQGRAPVDGVSRVRGLAWVSVAAAASLALVVVGLQPSGELDAPVQALSGATNASYDSRVDVLFADPDGMLIAATLEVDSGSIFADSLDM